MPVLFLLIALAPPAGSAEHDEATVTAAVQVTSNPAPVRAHSSPQIARNPTNGELVIAEADIRGDEACTIHLSVDDGRTWAQGGTPMREPFTDCTLHAEYGPYVNMAFSDTGTLYVAFVASAPDERSKELVARSVFLARSDDGGRTFSTTTVFDAPPDDSYLRVNKGPMLAVDPSDESRVYVGWRQGSFSGGRKLQSLVAASSDGGGTFAEPVDLTDERGGDYPSLAVDDNGTLHAVYWTRTDPAVESEESPVRPIYHRRSTDGGKTFSERLAIDAGNQDAEKPPLIVADPNSGALYVVWHAHAEEKDGGEDFEGDFDIFFLSSQDGGESWSDKLVVNDDQESVADQYLPGISVATDGRIDIAWYDDRSDPDAEEGALQEVYYAFSANGGRTFSRNLRVNDRSIDRSIGVWANNIASNHNVGVTSAPNSAYFAWQDSRHRDVLAQPEDIYMAKVNLDGPAPVGRGGDGSAFLWAMIGAGVATAVLGAVLLGLRVATRERQPSVPPQVA